MLIISFQLCFRSHFRDHLEHDYLEHDALFANQNFDFYYFILN
jgi:hypothetical protein